MSDERLSELSQWCGVCGRQLDIGTDWVGGVIEWCPNGCFEMRPVVRRSARCPKCCSSGWAELTGCRDCGHGVKVDGRRRAWVS